MLTYGPCQTPTLSFCVDQAERIKKFIPESFWKLKAVCDDTKLKGTFPLKWSRGKIYDRQCAKGLFDMLQHEKKAICETVKVEKLTKPRPVGLNTVKMLKVASKTYGMSSHETMHIAEHLYLRGFITYPRTESTTFSSNFNFKEILQTHAHHSEWGSYASSLLTYGFNGPKKGVDAGDHPPITPVKSADKDDLKDRDWQLYSFITKNFLACISADAQYEVIKATFRVGSEEFKIKGQKMIQSGFLEIMPW